MAETARSSPRSVLQHRDIFVQNIVSQPELNGLGGRVVGRSADGLRCAVRLHYTGRLLSLKDSCCADHPVASLSTAATASNNNSINQQEPIATVEAAAACPAIQITEHNSLYRTTAADTNKTYFSKHDEIYSALIGTIRRRPALRRELSIRACEGMKAKGPGALIIDMFNVNCVVPTHCLTADDILLDPQQTKFMSNAEMRTKFGRAFTKGRSIVGYKDVDREFPDLCKMSSAFADQISFDEWKEEDHGDPSSTSDALALQKRFYESHRYPIKEMLQVMREHFARRVLFGETPPMEPESKRERYIVSELKFRGQYDHQMEMMASVIPGDRTLSIVGNDVPIWKDDHAMGGYNYSFGFILLCLVPISVEMERILVDDGWPNVVDGWKIVGFDTVGFWQPNMERLTSEVDNDEELLKLFCKDKTAEVDEAALHYKGGSFLTNLPGSIRVKETECANPACTKKEIATKMYAKRVTEYSVGDTKNTRLYKCSRCQRTCYCSALCQKDHWKKHKKDCNKK